VLSFISRTQWTGFAKWGELELKLATFSSLGGFPYAPQ